MIPTPGDGWLLGIILIGLVGLVVIAAIVFLIFMLAGSIRLRRQNRDQDQAEDGSASA
ncbi:hypothetical protein [Nesterenkonia ebinurensis]|uniref:hypothetical protein n=1 Tax=Nesterenkonia ebinurensis TaxID=2608252 RepID=UPI00168A82A2|nr:hypothetical protein [Nesterenkonia ebinurensis]